MENKTIMNIGLAYRVCLILQLHQLVELFIQDALVLEVNY